jgi:hypothetical protein
MAACWSSESAPDNTRSDGTFPVAQRHKHDPRCRQPGPISGACGELGASAARAFSLTTGIIEYPTPEAIHVLPDGRVRLEATVVWGKEDAETLGQSIADTLRFEGYRESADNDVPLTLSYERERSGISYTLRLSLSESPRTPPHVPTKRVTGTGIMETLRPVAPPGQPTG